MTKLSTVLIEKGVLDENIHYAISTVYKEIFNTQTCYSGFLALGWTDESIIEQLLSDVSFVPIFSLLGEYKIFVSGIGSSSNAEWNHGGPGYKSSLLRSVNRKSVLYFSTIKDNFCAVEVHKDFEIKNQIEGSSPNEVDREISAWRAMLHASSCQNITPWALEESKYQLWTKNALYENDRDILQQLYNLGFLNSSPSYVPNKIRIFWQCFNQALADNKKTKDKKRRILSIIADDFSYSELKTNLGLTTEQLNQFELFFTTKENVNMSLYKTDESTGLPILYLQDHKKALWNKFHKEYPNGGLCTTCNELGYEVFEELESLINTRIKNTELK
ncbi:13380_t:CDS:2, partial [Cetraspora pellucida]